MTKEINEENIRVAAYYIWEQAGCPEGKDKECWIKACEQLFAPKKVSKPAVKAAAKKPEPKKVASKKVVPAKAAPVAKATKAPVKATAKPVAKPAAKPVAKPVAKVAAKKPTKAAPFYGTRK